MVKEKIGPLTDTIGNIVQSKESMCSLMNDYISSVFTIEDINVNLPIVDQLFTGGQPNMLSDINITKKLVSEKLNHIKPNKAGGVDGFGLSLFKGIAESICLPLSIIFRRSLEDSVVPDDWRLANVTAIFKSGDKTEPNNYRSVSLTSQACKIMESILKH